MASGTSTVDIRRSADRGASTTDWLQSRHSFSFADYYDPANTHHGLLLVNNDDIVEPAAGFDTHPHRDMEIVTWVLSGQLAHEDSMGNSGVIYPGLAQRMSAGTGVQHSEKNGSDSEPVHFVQMWVLPDTAGVTPSYQQQEIELTNTLTPIASGAIDAAVTVGNRDATLYGARLQPGDSVTLPRARFVHLFVARGTVTLEGSGPLAEGDAARLTDSGGRVTADADAEILVWEMNAGLGGV
ncbi:pirin family protein [Mycolicibacterium alvei]|jgi:redox-sensitive bicupin YhaK (pirin superfamily)|uniref:Quercetin 2,3-dioxygenase n=1 Tax=Mycolicibacterium alvei TaxID=67081 RepID=A0A6N4UX40_9MYCO|nr:pirin-like bicupin family protein [Mycolicibacterium alvei]MCV7001825.1 pirin family protein [Mycolicibacterium alvei]BBX28247.1 quercetin 2,3-dioxygenase [Mycolicibacterium alvei]